MATSPTVRRRRLTAELRRLRDAAGLTIDDVAERVGISRSALSRIENGLVTVRLPVVRALITVYGVPADAAAVLEQLAREAAQKGWWQSGAPLVPDATRTLIGLEAEARWVNDFSLNVITGLLQTRAYAAAVLRAVLPEATAADVEASIGFRVRRQERLGELRLWVIIAEEALSRPVGGPAVMRDQVEKLVERSRQPGITIQVLGRECGEHPGMSGPFSVIGFGRSEPEAVYVEGAKWSACVEDPSLVEAHKRAFDLLRAMALSPDQSLDRLIRLAKDHSS